MGALRRTIPNAFHLVGATTAIDLSSLPVTHGEGAGDRYDLRGCWITIQNKTGAAITLARGFSSVALPESQRATSIEDGAKEEYYVSERDDVGHFLRASAAGLLVCFDAAVAAPAAED